MTRRTQTNTDAATATVAATVAATATATATATVAATVADFKKGRPVVWRGGRHDRAGTAGGFMGGVPPAKLFIFVLRTSPS